MKDKNKRVLIGLSGGIDSAAASIMLMEQGYELVAVTMQVWGDAPAEAKVLADQLGIPHYIADEREEFKETVVKNFIDEYMQGKTPNPCVMCNPLFKFHILKVYADRFDCDWIATGHYGLIENVGDKLYLVAGRDHLKDQSYFLWRLNQEVLGRLLLPLGELTKTEVRAYLADKGFKKKSESGESMEVCFIKGDYRDFLKEHYPEIDKEVGQGWYVDSTGKKLGEHKGYPYYTIGQRKGLDIALGKPAYVLRINADKNTVILGDADQLKNRFMLVEKEELVDEESFFACDNLTVRIRYRSKPIPCKAYKLPTEEFLVHFAHEASAITPGQSAVFYDGNRVLGGAYIASQRGLDWIVEQNKDILK